MTPTFTKANEEDKGGVQQADWALAFAVVGTALPRLERECDPTAFCGGD